MEKSSFTFIRNRNIQYRGMGLFDCFELDYIRYDGVTFSCINPVYSFTHRSLIDEFLVWNVY